MKIQVYRSGLPRPVEIECRYWEIVEDNLKVFNWETDAGKHYLVAAIKDWSFVVTVAEE